MTRLAALHRTEADLLRIQKADDVYMKAVDSGDFNAMSETNKALHMAIMIDVIARKDADAAEKLAHEHTMLFQKRLLDYMRQNMTESMALL
ncbi:hypothetical protein PTKU46_46550 [Paraburkholderia terrae]